MAIKEEKGSIKMEDIINHVSKDTNVYKNQLNIILKSVFDYIVAKQLEGYDIKLQGYLQLLYKPHKARYAHNVVTRQLGMSKEFYTLQYVPSLEVTKNLKQLELNEQDSQILNNK